ncbi:MAG TPA: hypothetical protein VLL52_10390 [Anaerolineae bacterium]|nr:hypothetical protein [Anaerolineae bacterium]
MTRANDLFILQKKKHVQLDINWLDVNNYKKMPPIGSIYFAATARFVIDEAFLFSVILYYPEATVKNQGKPMKVNAHFLAPEIVLPEIKAGSHLYVTDGPKIIAEVTVLNIIND